MLFELMNQDSAVSNSTYVGMSGLTMTSRRQLSSTDGTGELERIEQGDESSRRDKRGFKRGPVMMSKLQDYAVLQLVRTEVQIPGS